MDSALRLSLVIPFYNQRRTLPYLLDSVLINNFSGLEVIVVDDCSDEDCKGIIAAFNDKGLSIRLVTHEKRLFTKHARISGMAAAAGKYIGFADADDILWGNGVLLRHVMLMEKEDADVLHFNTLFINADYTAQKKCHWTVPHARSLAGKDIFAAFVQRPNGPSVWCRLFSRELCLQVIPFMRETSVRRYGEDLLLTTLLLFHAQKYVGSQEVGYGYRWEPNKPERAPGRLATMFYMLTEVLPYLEKNGCDPAVLESFKGHLAGLMKWWADQLASWQMGDAMHFDPERFNTLFNHAEAQEFVKILLTCRQHDILVAKGVLKKAPSFERRESFFSRLLRQISSR